MKIFIYVLTEPDHQTIRYVGKSNEYRIDRRLIEHCRPSSLKSHTHKNCWIKSLLKKNQSPILKIIETCDETTFRIREKYWVSQYKQQGYSLTNGTEGGEGAIRIPNRIISEEQRRKISETWKKHPRFLEICSNGGKASKGIKRKFQFQQTSKFVGINQIKKTGHWRCYLWKNKKPIHVGVYLTEHEAVEAREKKRIELGL
jgi:hypothetical protein